MIELTRNLCQTLTTVLTRGYRRPYDPQPPLVTLQTDETGLTVRSAYRDLAFEYRGDTVALPQETVILPLDALRRVQGRDHSPVTLTMEDNRAVARWVDAGVPQVRSFDVPAEPLRPPFPETPIEWLATRSGLIAALDAASATTASDPVRYALQRIFIRGETGVVVGTDSKQLLLTTLGALSFDEDLLVARCGAFGCEELEHDDVRVSRTQTHLVIRSGPWSVWLAIDTVGRFPPYADVIPRPYQMKSSCELHPADVEFALKSLPKLPGRDDEVPAVTLDLNEGVVLRGRGHLSEEITELALTRSRVRGTPVRVCLRRDHLTNALKRGLLYISMAAADRPVVCRDRSRTYLMMPLASSQCIAPGDNTTRIDSATQPATPARGRLKRSLGMPTAPKLPEFAALLSFARDAGERINQLIAAIERQVPSPPPAARPAAA